jgi:protein SCO1/2
MRWRLVAIFLLLALPPAHAAAPDLSVLAYRQRLGSQIPLQTMFRDDSGRSVHLSDLIAGKPVILALVYFHCPNLCGIVRADLFYALGRTGMVANRDYTLIALSIDPSETAADAAAAKTDDMARYPQAGAAQGWHFLTGQAADVQAVAAAVGFRDRFDPELKQFLHPAGILFATPKGIVSSYLLGVGYQPADMRLAVTRAERGSVAAASLPVLLLCYHYDPSTGKYTLAIVKLLRLAGAITVVTIAGTLFLAFRRGRRGT